MSSDGVISLSLRRQQPSVVLAVGHLNDALRDVLAPDFRILQAVAVPDAIESTLATEQPDVLVVTRYLAAVQGGQPLETLLGAWRRAAPQTRFVWLLGDIDDEARALVRAAAQYGMYNMVAGNDLQVPDLVAAMTETRSWADIAAWMPEGFQEPAATRMALQPSAPSSQTVPATPQVVTRYAQVVAVVSGKANVGKTAVAANLLVAGRELGAIGIDLDAAKPDLLLQFVPEASQPADLRDLLNTLNLPPNSHGRAELDRNDLGLLAEWMDKLPEVMPGVTVVPGPSRDLAYTEVPPALVEALVARAATKARLVVLDSAFEIADQAGLDALYRADTLLVVTTPDQGAVYQTAWFLEQLEALRVPRGKMQLAVTHTGQKGQRGAGEIAQALRLPLVLQTSHDPAHYEAARVGRKPVALREGERGAYHQLLGRLVAAASDLAPEDAPKSGRGLLGRLRRR